MPAEQRLAVSDLTVSYGQHEVVHGISFDVDRGRMVALLGANGSGKSTTVKALTGVNAMGPRTRVRFNGTPVKPASLTTTGSRRLGIRVVHQEAPLISNMTVAEMAALHMGFPHAGGVVRHGELKRQTAQMLADFDVDVDPDAYCGELTTGERALVSLAISMAGIDPDRALLILDEATAALSTTDAKRLLDRVRNAVERGLSVVMVTHRLPEVREYCDRTLVLRDGDLVSALERESFSESAVIHAMVGDEEQRVAADARQASATVPERSAALIATGLQGQGVTSASFHVRPGEILGVTGRAGEGASELLRIIGGLEPATRGSVSVRGRELRLRTPRDAVSAGIFYLSPDRLSEGGVPTMTVHDNIVLPMVERYGLARRKAAADVAAMMDKLSIRPKDARTPFGSLSGGNQQKVLLARWLLLQPTVLVLDDPTAGVDPNTREIMFAILHELAAAGVSVLLRSTEPEHLARFCDRVIVMQGGRDAVQLQGAELTTEEISRATYA
ncbi:sugar ABC transporter ATP-binding protein [Streptomyces carpinensis]|nr:sugar ABC transporter ATP-binding protein [Streptomyces carpinensis]